MLLVVVALAGVMIGLYWILGERRPSSAKLSAYACGIQPTGDARQPFSVKFYLLAMIFILFEVEVIFLFPWAVICRDLKWFGFLAMLLFMLLVGAVFAYAWKKGALDWSNADIGDPR